MGAAVLGASLRSPLRQLRCHLPRKRGEELRSLIPLAGLFGKILLKLASFFGKVVAVLRRVAFDGDVGPDFGEVGIDLEPLAVAFVFGVGLDGVNWAFGFADTAINALIGMDDEEVFALIEAIYGAHFDAVHIFAFHAGVGDDVGHISLNSLFKRDLALRPQKVNLLGL
jgi:hypothetical protein